MSSFARMLWKNSWGFSSEAKGTKTTKTSSAKTKIDLRKKESQEKSPHTSQRVSPFPAKKRETWGGPKNSCNLQTQSLQDVKDPPEPNLPNLDAHGPPVSHDPQSCNRTFCHCDCWPTNGINWASYTLAHIYSMGRGWSTNRKLFDNQTVSDAKKTSHICKISIFLYLLAVVSFLSCVCPMSQASRHVTRYLP